MSCGLGRRSCPPEAHARLAVCEQPAIPVAQVDGEGVASDARSRTVRPVASVRGSRDGHSAPGRVYNLFVTPRERLPLSDAKIRAFCQKHHIRRLSLFGSVLRDDFGPSSDVDLLVEFEPEQVPGLLRLAAMERELSTMIGGRRVDMRTPRDLSRYFRDDVIAQAVVQYAQG